MAEYTVTFGPKTKKFKYLPNARAYAVRRLMHEFNRSGYVGSVEINNTTDMLTKKLLGAVSLIAQDMVSAPVGIWYDYVKHDQKLIKKNGHLKAR